MGRSQKALHNVSTGLRNKAILMILAFITKTVFVRLLGAEYNGISSLYSNILSVLSLAELGLGNVFMFYLYSSLKKNDKDEICALAEVFKRIYDIIIIFILVIGILIIPFLHYLVKSNIDHNKLILYYCLYLFNSVASYFVIYRTMIIRADQKEYIINNISSAVTASMYCFQLIYLFFFRNFIGYLIIQVICTIASNLIQNYIALKKYPFLKNKVKKHNTNIDMRELFSNIKATFIFKISDTILDQTDNIIISIMFGTLVVGYYANYYMLISYLVAIAAIIANGFVASFGNLYVEGDMEKSYKMFKFSLFLFSLYGAFCTACFASIIQEFIPVWIGMQYLMKYDLVFALLCVFYLRMATNTIWIYRSTMGLFKEVQYINLIAAFMNIIFSVIFGKLIGVSGIIIATALSRLSTSFWYEGKVVYNKFNKPVRKYYLQQLKNLIVVLIIVSTSFYFNKTLFINGFLGIILKLSVCAIFTIIVEILANYKTDEFNLLVANFKKFIMRVV